MFLIYSLFDLNRFNFFVFYYKQILVAFLPQLAMISKQSDAKIVSSIFYKYIVSNPICRSLMVPVLLVMVFAKYMEVLGASKTEELSNMIQKGQRNVDLLIKFSIVSFSIVVLVEFQAFAICKAGQLGYRIANRDAFKYFIDLNPASFARVGKGEIQHIINRKSEAIMDMIDVFTLNIFPTMLTMIFTTYSVFTSMGLDIAIIMNIGVLIYAILTVKIATWRTEMRKKFNIAQNNLSNISMDSLYNYETIFTYNSGNLEVEKYDNFLKGVEQQSIYLVRSVYFLNLAQKGVWCLMTVIIIVKSCFTSDGMIKIEKFAFLLSILGIVSKSIDNLGYLYGKLRTSLINVRSTCEEYEEIQIDGTSSIAKIDTDINVENLSVRMGNKPIFDNLSFNIKKGDKVAIIGHNGCGKSTLLKALVNLNKYKGRIFIDGINIKDLSKQSFTSVVTYVPQNPILFNETVISNIKYGNDKITDEEVYEVSKELGVHESILRLEDGYFTNVGEQGKSLSGGERQKVLMLRAVLRGSSVILMDEPTASLDKQSEWNIIQSVIGMKDLTIIAIVHNLELLRMFDRILKIENNSVVEFKGSDIKILPHSQSLNSIDC